MIRMKKGLAALAAACFLFTGMEKAQAVVGIPDDVPGNTLLYPFFKVNPSRTELLAQDTLIVATNTHNEAQLVHFVIWSSLSEHVYDFNVALTPNDVFSCSLYDLILGPGGCSNDGAAVLPAPSSVAARLTVLVDGVPQLRGYVTADAVTAGTSLLPTEPGYPRDASNVLIGHEYIVDLPAGSATGVNAVSLEFVDGAIIPDGHPAAPFPDTVTGFFTPTDGLERINGREGDRVQTATPDDTTVWYEIVRYLTVQNPGISVSTELWLWQDANNPALFVNLSIYDEAENFHSVSIDLPFEVNFRDVGDLITPGAPGGWFRIPLDEELQSVAYSLQLANDASVLLRWDALFPAHRQYTNYRP